MQTNKYNATCDRLFQLLDATRDQWNTSVIRLPSPSPNDDFRAANPNFAALVQQVEKEFDYEMSDMQCSWSILCFWKYRYAAFMAARARLEAA